MRSCCFAVALLAAHGSARPRYCTPSRRNKGARPHCSYPVELRDSKPLLFCVRNEPLSAGMFLKGGLLRLFDVQSVSVRGDQSLATTVECQSASEDSWSTGALTNQTAETRALAALAAPESSVLQQQLAKLKRTMKLALGADSRTYRAAFSPFYASCVALRATGGAVNVTVEWFRDGPVLPSGQSGRAQAGRDASSLSMWSGPAIFGGALFLFIYANTLAESVLFHYASGVTLSMALGVLLVAMIVWHRTGRRRPVLAFSAFLSFAGVTASVALDWARDAAVDILRHYWPYVLAYFGAFGALGYFYTAWRLRGGRPEGYEVALLCQAMRLVSLIAILCSTHSLRASATLAAGVVGAHFTPRAPLRLLSRKLWRASEPKPAGAPSGIMPPTPSGKYLSQEQYAAQGQIATDSSLQQLFSSPQYQSWLMANHQRMKMDEAEGGPRQLEYDDSDDDDDE